ncbi:sulfatase [soil metagenome]
MTTTPENVLLIHWHDLGRHLNVYGAEGVVSPRTDELAGEGIVFTRAHAAAPLCSPSRGALLTGRYPHDNGLIGLAHHGWKYKSDVQTLPQLLSAEGWQTVLFGMQHESSHPETLGYDRFDVSNSYCDHVVAQAQEFLAGVGDTPFLLNAGFFETHRPYPHDQYDYADPGTVEIPPQLPDTPAVREDLAGFYGSITKADAAVGRLLGTLAHLGLDQSTWVVFFTDHGAAFPRAKSTLYDAGTGISFIVRPPRRRSISPGVYDELFSGVDLVPTLLDLLGVAVPEQVQGVSHAGQLFATDQPAARDVVFTEKTYHDTYDPIRAVRTRTHSYIENYTERPLLDMPLDILDSLSGSAIGDAFEGPRPPRELYDLVADPGETANLADQPDHHGVQDELAQLLHAWRSTTEDSLPSDADGSALAASNMIAYLKRHPQSPTVVQRSALATDRGIEAAQGSKG